MRLSPTIADALTLGTGKLAVDAVLLIAEHGDYPLNAKLQKLYPRGRFFREVLDVVRALGPPVPVFIDKHLSYSRAEAQQMVDQARALNVPLMAGSSLPVTWRLPAAGDPAGPHHSTTSSSPRAATSRSSASTPWRPFSAWWSGATARASRRASSPVTCLEGDAVWKAGDQGVWSWDLLRHALGRSHTLNPGDIKQNTRDFACPPPATRPRILNSGRSPSSSNTPTACAPPP